MLVQDTKGRSYSAPTLANISFKALVLSPITRIMAEKGRIKKTLESIQEAALRFYELENEKMHEEVGEPEKDDKEAKRRMCRSVKQQCKGYKGHADRSEEEVVAMGSAWLDLKFSPISRFSFCQQTSI